MYLLFTVNARGYSYIMKYKCQISVAVGTATLRLMFAGEEAGAWGVPYIRPHAPAHSTGN